MQPSSEREQTFFLSWRTNGGLSESVYHTGDREEIASASADLLRNRFADGSIIGGILFVFIVFYLGFSIFSAAAPFLSTGLCSLQMNSNISMAACRLFLAECN